MRLHQKETAKRLSFFKYWKLINIGHYNDNDDFLSFEKTSKEARWSCFDLPSIKIVSKMCIKMMSIICPSKLHQKGTSKWRGNSLILMCRRNFGIHSTCWVCWYNWAKLILVSTQNHRCFNFKFWCYFNVDKMTLFRRRNTVISSTFI